MLPRWGSGRMTPWDDRHIKAKLVELEHSIEEKTALRDCAIYVEGLLKKASDDLEEKHNKKEHYVDIPENRILVGVMKVGDYAKGTGLPLGLTWVILICRPPSCDRSKQPLKVYY